jgi:hypothetical protein
MTLDRNSWGFRRNAKIKDFLTIKVDRILKWFIFEWVVVVVVVGAYFLINNHTNKRVHFFSHQ